MKTIAYIGQNIDGIVCDVNEEEQHILIYDRRNDGLVVVPTAVCDGKIGDYVVTYEDELLIDGYPMSITDVDEIDGVLHFNVLGVAPATLTMPLPMRKKYIGVAWSPFIGLISDPDELAGEAAGEQLELTVKFAPSNDRLFEVVSYSPWPEKKTLYVECYEAPWDREIAAESRSTLVLPFPDSLRTNPFKPNKSRHFQFFGIVVEKGATNTLSRGSGAPELVDMIYSNEIGTIRARPVENAPLGSQVMFRTNDNRRNSVAGGRNKNHSEAMMGTGVVVMDAVPKNTRVENGRLFIKTWFLFRRQDLLNENGEPRDDAHFTDLTGGKCEIYIDVVGKIVKIVDDYFARLEVADPTQFAVEKDEKVVVAVEMIPFPNPHKRHMMDINAAIFSVVTVLDVHFLLTGKSLMN